MPHQFIVIIIAAAALLVIGGISFLSNQASLSNIKAKPVGDGQHGTARWATPKEIGKTFHHVPFHPAEWRKGLNRPKVQGLVLGSLGKKGRITALVDSDDIHCLMIGAAGVGKLNHGFGVKSMSETVRKYGGNVLFDAKSEKFTVVVLIPIPAK